jgi:hypothetical protein
MNSRKWCATLITKLVFNHSCYVLIVSLLVVGNLGTKWRLLRMWNFQNAWSLILSLKIEEETSTFTWRTIDLWIVIMLEWLRVRIKILTCMKRAQGALQDELFVWREQARFEGGIIVWSSCRCFKVRVPLVEQIATHVARYFQSNRKFETYKVDSYVW